MSLIDALALFVMMTTLALVPSTSVALVVTRSAAAGFANGAAVTAGIVLGDLVFVLFTLLGMAALAEVMGSFFLILRYIAGAYLVWFGISLFTSHSTTGLNVHNRSVSTLTLPASFISGFVVTLGDVKAIFFYASLFPAFVDMASLNALDITLIVVLTVVTVGGVKLAYAYGAKKMVSLAAGGLKMERIAKTAAGAFMIGAGTSIVVKA